MTSWYFSSLIRYSVLISKCIMHTIFLQIFPCNTANIEKDLGSPKGMLQMFPYKEECHLKSPWKLHGNF